MEISMVNSLPPGILEALSEMKHAVEFDKLTDDFVVSIEGRSLKVKHGVLINPANPGVASRQHELSEKEYHEGLRRWLDAIRVFRPKYYPIWKKLYDTNMFGSAIQIRTFEERREYDILLRSNAKPVGMGRPSWDHKNLWAAAEAAIALREKNKAKAEKESLDAQLAELKRLAAHPPQKSFLGSSSDRSRTGGSTEERKGAPPAKQQPEKLSGPRDPSTFKKMETIGRSQLLPMHLRKIGDSAILSTLEDAAREELAPEEDMSVHSAGSQPTLPLSARPKPPWPVTTPLRLARWQFYFEKFGILDEFADVLHGIEFGFSYNSSITISESRIFPNMQSARDSPNVIKKTIEKELDAGRYKGPFTQKQVEELLGPFLAHPLGVVQKNSYSKPRMIEDLSYPQSNTYPSLNSLSDTSAFTLDWGSLAETIGLMVEAPEGTQAATIDIEGAFRTIGIKPSEFWMGVVQGSDQVFHVDLAAKFGGKASIFIFEVPAKGFCIIIILSFNNLVLVRWVDDIMPIRYPVNPSPPFFYAVELAEICAIGVDLGFKFPEDKIKDFAAESIYLGFLWCWDLKEVVVPEEKRLRYVELMRTMRGKEKISLEELRSLCGKLSHLAMIILEGRSNMRALWRMLARMDATGMHPKASWELKESQRKNLDWWEEKLSVPRVGLQLCTMAVPDESFGLFCDASTSYGIGIVIEGLAESFKFKPGWETFGGITRDIGFAEFAALHILVFIFLSSRKIRNHHIKVYSDNTGVVGAWRARSSSNIEQNEILGAILRMLIARRCFMTVEYIKSADNPADAPSRGLFTEKAKKVTFRGFPSDYSEIISRNLE